ncbi:MAG: nucleoside-diphosphate kinase [Candidatus Omnitrophica bacterium]|nr:nucleoside-diphosphate kinase [Candidatus Omnitrophota bacterium]MBU0880783.1 nucleoside-diphosphate kinase [Candidatus Omnitrophota bacterium]MBU0895168.1 nucleoside-diphosphate kinase [Candidatus Omnitrophota bacterium]MBU1809105.1 nucleoside-diphosphate kinase [Candidatus Omnitrophota bacterium]
MAEQTLVLIKPDGLSKSLTGNVLARLSETKLEIAAARIVQVSKELAEQHYALLKDKPFFTDLIKYIMGDYHKKKVMALVYWGDDALAKVRKICGATNPEEADPVSIRGAYGRITTKGVYENVIHASTNIEEAEREIKLWFSPDEIIMELYPSKKVMVSVEKRVWV